MLLSVPRAEEVPDVRVTRSLRDGTRYVLDLRRLPLRPYEERRGGLRPTLSPRFRATGTEDTARLPNGPRRRLIEVLLPLPEPTGGSEVLLDDRTPNFGTVPRWCTSKETSRDRLTVDNGVRLCRGQGSPSH